MKASKGKSIRSGPYSSGSGKGKEPDEGRMLSVSGIPFKAEWQEIKDHMGQAGTVEFAEHLIGNDGRPKGVAFVRYATLEEAQNAIETLSGTYMPNRDGSVCGQTLEVRQWTGAPPPKGKGGGKADF